MLKIVFECKNVDLLHYLLSAETLVKLTKNIRVTNLALISSHRFAWADIFFAEKEEKRKKKQF